MYCVCVLCRSTACRFVFILILGCRWPIAKIICGHRPSHINYVERERDRERDWDSEIDLLRCLVSSSDWQFAQLVTDLYKDLHTKRRHFGTIDKAVGDVTHFKCRQVSLCLSVRLWLFLPMWLVVVSAAFAKSAIDCNHIGLSLTQSQLTMLLLLLLLLQNKFPLQNSTSY